VTAGASLAWRQVALTSLLVFAIVAIGCAAAFGFWLQDFTTPQVVLLGSGDRLSLLVADGPARLILATGNDPIEYENALAAFRPLFARRVDVLLLAGQEESLRVPLRARADSHARAMFVLSTPPALPGYEALSDTPLLASPRRIQLSATIAVSIETAMPLGADPDETAPYWRATIERGDTRIVVLSDGEAAAFFPPGLPASVLAVSGRAPAAAWGDAPAMTFVANADAISGPEMRSAFTDSRQPPAWGFRVAPGEALRIHFTKDGIEIPSQSAQELRGTPIGGDG
jgi:hypothetical protein